MKWLLRDDFPTISKEQTETHAPLQTNQATVVAQRRRGKHAMQALLISHPRASELVLGEPLEMMNMKIFISFAFGVPQNRHLDTLDFIKRHSTD